MARRASVSVVAILLLGIGAMPAVADAASKDASGVSSQSAGPLATGGAGVATLPAGLVRGGTLAIEPAVEAADQIETASGAGITLTSQSSVLMRRDLKLTGSIASAAPGETLVIELSGSQAGAAWTPIATAITGADGTFTASWHVNRSGQLAIRALIAGGSASTPTLPLTVYRPAIATLYGPGLYGRRTACGKVLRRGTLGVANRTLPCGTSIAIDYRGRGITVPVIDRGPYANNATWDLTAATAHALNMTGTATIGALTVAPASAQ